MVEQALDKKALIAELVRSAHGSLQEYVPVASRAARDEPDFYAHLIAWNERNGQVRDARVALPAIAWAYGLDGPEYDENAIAHLAAHNPRMFLQGLDFARTLVTKPAPVAVISQREAKRLVMRYLRNLEADAKAWERVALQHRETMRVLYGRYHIAPGAGTKAAPSKQDVTLMKGAATTGKFAAVRVLNQLPAAAVQQTITKYKLPFLIVRGALGARAKEPAILVAIIKSMTDVELVSNVRLLKRLGAELIPEARAALEQAIDRAGNGKHAPRATLKATRAAESLEDSGDDRLASKMRGLQERQLSNLGGVEGDWLVLADKSGSMQHSIDTASQIAAVLARMVTGKVHLVFFDDAPTYYYDVTGKDYEQVKKLTASVKAGGGTSIGCGLQRLVDSNLEVQGIAIVSDGAHHHGISFQAAYRAYQKQFDTAPTVYFYRVDGETDTLSAECKWAGIDLQIFDLSRKAIDYHSLPGICATMRTQRYSLLDEIMQTPLLTLDEVLTRTIGQQVVLHAAQPVPA